eukprot:TRINITY_DN4080_c1_g2_i1.p1 TRINITY_DN4080_c1_g2~~TRINITY_DN4080_c1_g2_i1.p1  ORF type:complete len:1386 (+),score=388.13 TRINITY_DN4080_c1_g2_i1:44-4201(+)
MERILMSPGPSSGLSGLRPRASVVSAARRTVIKQRTLRTSRRASLGAPAGAGRRQIEGSPSESPLSRSLSLSVSTRMALSGLSGPSSPRNAERTQSVDYARRRGRRESEPSASPPRTPDGSVFVSGLARADSEGSARSESEVATPVTPARRRSTRAGLWFTEVDQMLRQPEKTLDEIADSAEREFHSRSIGKTVLSEARADAAEAGIELRNLYNHTTRVATDIDSSFSGAETTVCALQRLAQLQRYTARAVWLHRSVDQRLAAWEEDMADRERLLLQQERLMDASAAFYRAEIQRLRLRCCVRACFTALRASTTQGKSARLGREPQPGVHAGAAVALEVPSWSRIARRLPGVDGHSAQLRALRVAWHAARDTFAPFGGYLSPASAPPKGTLHPPPSPASSANGEEAEGKEPPAAGGAAVAAACATRAPDRTLNTVPAPRWSVMFPDASSAARAVVELPHRLSKALWGSDVLAACRAVYRADAGCCEADWLHGLQVRAGISLGSVAVPDGGGVLSGPAVRDAFNACRAARGGEAVYTVEAFESARADGSLVGVTATALPPWPLPRIDDSPAETMQLYAALPVALRSCVPKRNLPPAARVRRTLVAAAGVVAAFQSTTSASPRDGSGTASPASGDRAGENVLALNATEEEAQAAVSNAELRVEERTADLRKAHQMSTRLKESLDRVRKDRDRLEAALGKARQEIQQRDREEAVAFRERAAVQQHRMRMAKDAAGESRSAGSFSAPPESLSSIRFRRQDSPRRSSQFGALSRASTRAQSPFQSEDDHVSPVALLAAGNADAERQAAPAPVEAAQDDFGAARPRRRVSGVRPRRPSGSKLRRNSRRASLKKPKQQDGGGDEQPAAIPAAPVAATPSDRKSAEGPEDADGPWCTPRRSDRPPAVPLSPGPAPPPPPAPVPPPPDPAPADQQGPMERLELLPLRRRSGPAFVGLQKRGSEQQQQRAQRRATAGDSSPSRRPVSNSAARRATPSAPASLRDAGTQVTSMDVERACGANAVLAMQQGQLAALAGSDQGKRLLETAAGRQKFAMKLRALRDTLASHMQAGDQCLAYYVKQQPLLRGSVMGPAGPGRFWVRFPQPFGRVSVGHSQLEAFPPANLGEATRGGGGGLAAVVAASLQRKALREVASSPAAAETAAVAALAAVTASSVDAEDLMWYAGYVWQLHRKVQRFHCLLVMWLGDPTFALRAEWVSVPCRKWAELPPGPMSLGGSKSPSAARRRCQMVDVMLRHQGDRAMLSHEDESAARSRGDLPAALCSVEGLLARCCAALTRSPVVNHAAPAVAARMAEQQTRAAADSLSQQRLRETGGRRGPKPGVGLSPPMRPVSSYSSLLNLTEMPVAESPTARGEDMRTRYERKAAAAEAARSARSP